jgi:putative endonuclease
LIINIAFTLRHAQGERESNKSIICISEPVEYPFVVSLSNHAPFMSFWVYILKCADGSYYTGHTDNLEIRLAQHHSGSCDGYTSTRLPVVLTFSQEFPTREEALISERRIKGWSRKKKEAMMRGDWKEVSRLAKSKGRK